MSPLVTAEALGRELTGNPALILVDARRSRDAYLAAHLPGARWVDLETELSRPCDPRFGGRHPLPEPEHGSRVLARLGIRTTTPVVAYDDAGGALAAARVWWMLRAAGHEHVRVLDGGLAAAQRAGLALVAGEVPDASSEDATLRVTAFDRLPTVDADDVERVRLDPSWLLLDVRAPERYRGEVEPLDPVAGHIAGAVNAPYAENLGGDGCFLAPEALRARYEALLAGRSPSRVIVSCGSGVTACHTLLAMEHAGLAGARLYVGSWSEWCRNPARARTTGASPLPSP